MNRDQVQGNWKQRKGKTKYMWGDLTDEEIEWCAGGVHF
ncbi:MAG: CsbD family protein [Gammaproteobacteria bacterium]